MASSKRPPGSKTIPPKAGGGMLPKPPPKPVPTTGPHTLASLKPAKPPVSTQPSQPSAVTAKPVPKKTLAVCVPKEVDSVSCKLNMQPGGKVLRLVAGATLKVDLPKDGPIEIRVLEVKVLTVEGIDLKIARIEHTAKTGVTIATSLLF